MAVPASAVGTELAPLRAKIERGRLRFFAEAIGETDPAFIDLDTAIRAGYPDLPVPPTFLFGLKLDRPDAFAWLIELGVDLRFILHGSQRFDYERMTFAGDDLLLESRISDVYEKRGGALEFVVVDTDVTRVSGAGDAGQDDRIARFTETIVVRHPELEVAR